MLALFIIIGCFHTFSSFAPPSSFSSACSSRHHQSSLSFTPTQQITTVSLFSKKQPDDDSDDRYNQSNEKEIHNEDLKVGSTSPPDGNKTLGDYFQDGWWKDGITEREKEVAQKQRIEDLRDISAFREAAQDFLKIDLEYFLKTGKDVLRENSARGIPERVAGIDYDIRDSKLLYKRDVIAFKNRVEKLFEWKTSEQHIFMAPYFPLIQSSGTGKTKLMHECRAMFGSDSNVHCELILCHDGEVTDIVPEKSIFTQTLDVSKIPTNTDGRNALWKQLNGLVEEEKTKVQNMTVLLFDESQHLNRNDDGWHFRTIRWWLRIPRVKNVVCVFAGTSTSLANYFAEPKVSTSSRDASIKYNTGNKLYAPFYEITTTGLVSCTDGSRFGSSRRAIAQSTETHEKYTEFDVAVQYGRPLFARMHLKGELKGALGPILLRMRGVARDTSEDEDSTQQDFSILATRLQMGQVSFDFASKQVASGYAHLTHFAPEQTAVAEIAYLPDPVCAWLGMTQMIKKCSLYQSVNGIKMQSSEDPSVWSKKAIKIYSSALCRPEKGDVGEVAAAFYMLACGDELRYEQSKELTKLSVPLEMWINSLQGNHGRNLTTDAWTEGPTINFIQVCRNYLRHSLEEMQNSGLLKQWYRGARASYAYASCPAYDLLIPVEYELQNGDVCYCPMLVSVKNRLSYSEKQRATALAAMKAELEGMTGVCMLFLIGLEHESSETSQNSATFEFSYGAVSTVVIEVPKRDRFGATNLAMCSTCGGGEKSEVMVSHTELALGAQSTFARLLRSKTKGTDPSREFLKDIVSHYNEVYNKTKAG